MAGKKAKILSEDGLRRLLEFADGTRDSVRNRLMVLLSAKAGLRAGEIANLTWEMVLQADGNLSSIIELWDKAAKKGSGRTIPINSQLADAFEKWSMMVRPVGPVIKSERGGPMTPLSVVVWFNRAFKKIGLQGCSSHSGRRTFITRAARLVHRAGGSLRDVQLLAGHRSIQTTQGYIEGDSESQRRLVSLL